MVQNWVIQLVVDENALIERIEKRAKESGESGTARTDDNAATLQKRLDTYRSPTAPILPYYKNHGILKTVDGMAAVEEVTRQIAAILDAA